VERPDSVAIEIVVSRQLIADSYETVSCLLEPPAAYCLLFYSGGKLWSRKRYVH
jgi:hypothetical protein